MPGVGKLLKQAQKMQKLMEEAQAKLSEEILEVSGGGGAVTIQITGQESLKISNWILNFSRKTQNLFLRQFYKRSSMPRSKPRKK